jgi:hypothetical protein
MAIVCELAGEGGASITLTFGALLPGDELWIECALTVVMEKGVTWRTEDSGMTADDLLALVRFARGEMDPVTEMTGVFESSMGNLIVTLSEVQGRDVVWGTAESNTSALQGDEDGHESDGVNFHFAVGAEALAAFGDAVAAVVRGLSL